MFSQRYERGSILVTTYLPFDGWTEVPGPERVTGALQDRLTHNMHILEMNSDSRPWVTGPQGRSRTHGKVHRNQCWYHRQEQQDSRLIRTRSCPNTRVHLSRRLPPDEGTLLHHHPPAPEPEDVDGLRGPALGKIIGAGRSRNCVRSCWRRP